MTMTIKVIVMKVTITTMSYISKLISLVLRYHISHTVNITLPFSRNLWGAYNNIVNSLHSWHITCLLFACRLQNKQTKKSIENMSLQWQKLSLKARKQRWMQEKVGILVDWNQTWQNSVLVSTCNSNTGSSLLWIALLLSYLLHIWYAFQGRADQYFSKYTLLITTTPY